MEEIRIPDILWLMKLYLQALEIEQRLFRGFINALYSCHYYHCYKKVEKPQEPQQSSLYKSSPHRFQELEYDLRGHAAPQTPKLCIMKMVVVTCLKAESTFCVVIGKRILMTNSSMSDTAVGAGEK